MSSTIGRLSDARGIMEFDWKIADFFQLLAEPCNHHDSPTFYFAGASWYVRIYSPHGKGKSVNQLALFLKRGDSGQEIYLKCVLSFFIGNEQKKAISCAAVLDTENFGCGKKHFISMLELLEWEQIDTAVTITCLLEYNGPKGMQAPTCHRLQSVSDNLKALFLNQKWSDVVLNVGGRKIPAHKMILATRSSVFSAMFSHDMKENLTNEVTIESIDIKSFMSILFFMYCGQVHGLSTERVFSIFAAADKYDLNDLKTLCLEFVEEKLTPEWLFDVIKFADFYKVEQTERVVRKFFKENAMVVLETEQWKTFSKENHEICLDLVVSAFKELFLRSRRRI